MQALSMQAAVAVVDAHDAGGDEALKVLTSIAQNFPMQVRLIAAVAQSMAHSVEHANRYVARKEGLWLKLLSLRVHILNVRLFN